MRLAIVGLVLIGCGSSGSTRIDDMGVADLSTAGDLSRSGDAAASITRNDVYITWYGFNDNSCQTEEQHSCDDISFPMNGGWPTQHDGATEGLGTYASPNTFATAANQDGTDAELAVGTRIYVPSVRKYFVMEDRCAECAVSWNANHTYHTDLWMGPAMRSDDTALGDCEDQLTIGEENAGTGTIIIDPPSDLTVDTNPLFINNTCTAHQY